MTATREVLRRQISRVVKKRRRPAGVEAHCVYHLRQEGRPAEMALLVQEQRPRMAEHDGQGQDCKRGQADPEQQSKGAMKPIVPEDRQNRRGRGHGQRDRRPVQTPEAMGAAGHKLPLRRGCSREHADQSPDLKRNDHAAKTELGARLDHLRETHFGTLRRMEEPLQHAPPSMPRAPARMLNPIERPRLGPTKPMAMAKRNGSC